MFTELSEIDCVTSCDTGPGSAISIIVIIISKRTLMYSNRQLFLCGCFCVTGWHRN